MKMLGVPNCLQKNEKNNNLQKPVSPTLAKVTKPAKSKHFSFEEKEIYNFEIIKNMLEKDGYIVSYVGFNSEHTQTIKLQLNLESKKLMVIDINDNNNYFSIPIHDIIYISYCDINQTASLLLMNQKMKINKLLTFSIVDMYYQTYDYICDNESIPLYILPILILLTSNKGTNNFKKIIHNLYMKRAIYKIYQNRKEKRISK